MKKTPATIVAATTAVAALIATASVATADDGKKNLNDHQRQLLSVNETEYTGKGTVRISGGDRYETAVALSQTTWSPGSTGAVYLVVGTRFPDGIAAAPSAGISQLGPILFTEANQLPEVTRAEIQRLQPCLILVVGDAAAVSPEVAAQADQYTDPGRCFS
jgi:putative cell wall-binding protein